MGLEITSTARQQSKHQYTIAATAAASVVVADGELVTFVGATAQTRLEALNGLRTCRNKLREVGWPNPTTLQFASVMYDTVTNIVTVVEDGLLPTLTEDVVAVIRGLDYTGDGQSCSPYCTRMGELYLEISQVVFTGTVADQTWTVDVLITPLDLSAFFTGTTPITYVLTTGSWPTGISMDTNGLVTGTPTLIETELGLVVTGTNYVGSSATNSFDTAVVA